MKSQHVGLILLLWLGAAIAAVTAGLLTKVFPPPIIGGLALLTILLVFLVSRLRTWMEGANLRLFLLPHLFRFVGIAFLVLVARGELIEEFRMIGWGDTIAAIGALALLVIGPPGRKGSTCWWSWLAWNTFGLLDMLLLMSTALRLGPSQPEAFTLFQTLPFGLLPTFIVPLIIATHVLLFVRLLRMGGRS